MKKKLLLFGALLCTALTTSAQDCVERTFYENDFKTFENMVPEGWILGQNSDYTDWRNYDGGKLYGNGCRVLTFTGEKRDLDAGIYIRQNSTDDSEGFALYTITDAPVGQYTITAKVCNWNRKDFDPITLQLLDSSDNVLGEATVTPTCNIGNSASNSFEGVSDLSLSATVTKGGSLKVKFVCANHNWADAIIGKVKITGTVATTDAIHSVEVRKARSNVRYNLAGQRVDSAYTGIVIRNGKKMIQ